MTANRIVIVGGGAGGLALASKLGRKLGLSGEAEICLVDKSPVHIWKPKLHEVAVGVIDQSVEGLLYRDHGLKNGYRFLRGELAGCDPQNKSITLSSVLNDDGEELIGQREIEYDYLVLAIGGISNSFNTPGAEEHCIFLDNLESANRFHQKLLDDLLLLDETNEKLSIGIVGAGATGVELAAELHHVLESVKDFGYLNIDKSHLEIHLIEAAQKILPALPDKVSARAQTVLDHIGVRLHIGVQVKEVVKEGFVTQDGVLIASGLKVWAAGVKGPDALARLTELPISKRNQVEVDACMRVKGQEHIYAIGDCAMLIQDSGRPVPPRAQAASQMAETLYKNLLNRLKGKAEKPFVYQDYGSLVSLSRFSAVGNLMGNLRSRSLFIEGYLARMMYMSLYQRHLASLYGWFSAAIYSLAQRLLKWQRPKLKLH
ncbi:NAD(P)/FAD-dependent oxidoreductase [Shewanella sp. A3A]|uniref:NAD(P)/FAD-dependent oxidoreductase n=1 Tax=Shewanella electrica TaxID=515560 RepID=A0ABT2FIY8_9GAMM|nr:NAD(P)/FAD-dependent oxidoreductase [Shewanella electrica]MCH1920193.1 NAD(P)/FAD-dependent oxidoreductase [Shewanella ferrihydritica]MCH1924403.1 NAD(P)/FAD-dependent oxidoreductase [Shewanella electrica]MCS4556304.1 NAD(P)/FAD-dependent oxidoreductase [Shewanella electrica]